MASETDICNLALARLGDAATVSDINPPAGSAQASHCATFYPIVRAFMLDDHNWGFSTTRVALAMLSAAPLMGWLYAFASPSATGNIIAVYVGGAPDDSSPVDFEREVLPDGTGVVYCNIVNPVAKISIDVVDTSRFPPLFVEAMSWLLAAALAGPVIKGETGRQMAGSCYATGIKILGKAKANDGNQRQVRPLHVPAWVGVRSGSLQPFGIDTSFNPPIG